MTRKIPAGLLALCLVTTPAQGMVEFVFNYVDVGTGFNDPTFGPDRRAALELAAQTFGASALGNYNAIITIDANGTALPLAAAGTAFVKTQSNGGFGRAAVIRNKILSNGANDLNGGDADGFIEWDFDQTDWQLDINVPVGASEFDFYSTAYHEFSHAIGFNHTINFPDGSDSFGGGVAGSAEGEWAKFDQFISDGAGNRIINETTLLNTNPANFAALAEGGASPAGGLFFNGPNAVAANGGNPVGLYTPQTYLFGSSVGHLDDDNPAFANMLMLSAVEMGNATRTFSEVELAILRDLGYTDIQQIAPIPIPAPFVLLLSGFGVLLALWRKSAGI